MLAIDYNIAKSSITGAIPVEISKVVLDFSELSYAYPINHYNKSSGTMGNPKRLPMSDRAIEVFDRYIKQYIYGVIVESEGMAWVEGKNLCIVESTDSIPVLPCGTTYG